MAASRRPASTNSERNTIYYNPRSDLSTGVSLDAHHILRRRYDWYYWHRLQGSTGLDDETGFKADWYATARYEQHFEWQPRHALVIGVDAGRRVYDGDPEKWIGLIFSFTTHFLTAMRSARFVLVGLWLVALGQAGAGELPSYGRHFLAFVYHDVTRDRATLEVDGIMLGDLVAHFDFLRAEGQHVVSMQDVFDARDSGRPPPPRAVLLTFDDGRISDSR